MAEQLNLDQLQTALMLNLLPGWHVVKPRQLNWGHPHLDHIQLRNWCLHRFGKDSENQIWRSVEGFAFPHVSQLWLFQNQEDAAEFALIWG